MKRLITLLLLLPFLILAQAPQKMSYQAVIRNAGNTDNDGNTFTTVVIGTQEWTQKNLNVTHYRNGDVIPQVTDPTVWAGLTTGAWCYYANDSANGTTYGKLYNWYAVNDPRGLAPAGWHVPSDTEWTILTTFLGGNAVAGGKMKETGTTHWISPTAAWISPNTAVDNSSGFTGLMGGARNDDGAFGNIGNDGIWWSSTEISTTYAWFGFLMYDDGLAGRNDGHKAIGLSVRCLRD